MQYTFYAKPSGSNSNFLLQRRENEIQSQQSPVMHQEERGKRRERKERERERETLLLSCTHAHTTMRRRMGYMKRGFAQTSVRKKKKGKWPCLPVLIQYYVQCNSDYTTYYIDT